MDPVTVRRGRSPVILAMPHVGLHVPDDILAGLNDTGRGLTDADWHIERLYDGLLPDATIVRATHHRYVIDANRDPAGASLYPGQNTTGLVPMTDFDGAALWRTGHEPDAAEIERRRLAVHARYHAALWSEILRIRAARGIAVVYDCHSIRSYIPFLFDGRLPDLNIGTFGGKSCDPRLEAAVMDGARRAAADGYTHVRNGRFQGGWTTRHYGRPGEGIHTIQMELAQSTYLAAEQAPFAYDAARADRLRVHLAALLTEVEAVAVRLTTSEVSR